MFCFDVKTKMLKGEILCALGPKRTAQTENSALAFTEADRSEHAACTPHTWAGSACFWKPAIESGRQAAK